MNNEMTEHQVLTISNSEAARSAAVMEQWGGNEVYSEDRWVERARQAARKTMEGMFELGRALIILKEHTEHGRFVEIAETELGLHKREAQRLMNATRRFATPQMQKAAPKLMDLGKSKLLELLVEEDDDTLAELADGGDLNGHTLDDIDRMTRNELRAALKESREDTEAARQVSADKDAKINALTERLEKSKRQAKDIPPADVAENLKLNIGAMQVGIESQIMRLKPALTELSEHAAEHSMDHTPWMVGVLNQLIRDIESVREAVSLPAQARADGKPVWLIEE